MIGRVLLAAVLAGLAAGLVMGVIQHVRLTPLIVEAEKYEHLAHGHGAASADGRIKGCYLHGLFTSDQFRADFLADLGLVSTTASYDAGVEAALDALADHLELHLDLDRIDALAEPV